MHIHKKFFDFANIADLPTLSVVAGIFRSPNFFPMSVAFLKTTFDLEIISLTFPKSIF